MVNYVVIGGGIAGVACAEELCRVVSSTDSVLLLSASETIKGIKNYVKLTDVLEKFDIEEQSLDFLQSIYAGQLSVRQCIVERIDPNDRSIHLNDGSTLFYDKLCISTGAAPRVIVNHPLVLGLRDTQSASHLALQLQTCRRVVLLGNGGIALGIVHALQDATDASLARPDGRGAVQLVWAVRDEYAGSTLLDASASAFLLASSSATSSASAPSGDSLPASAAEDMPLLRGIVRAPVAAGGETQGWQACVGGGGGGEGLLVEDSTTVQLMRGIPIQAQEAHMSSSSSEADRSRQRSSGDGASLLTPLPPRQRTGRAGTRHKSQAAPPEGTSSSSSSSSAGAGVGTVAGAGTKRSRESDTSEEREGQAAAAGTAAATGTVPVPVPLVPLGSSLGPTWMKVLQQVGVSSSSSGRARPSLPDTTSSTSSSTSTTSTSSSSSGSATWPPPFRTGGTLLETGVEAVAIRGSPGTAGAVGVLADGLWHSLPVSPPTPGHQQVMDEEEQEETATSPWPLWVKLSNGHVYGCDLIVSATGVEPCTDILPQGKEHHPPFVRGPDGGLVVNQHMQTTGSPLIYAAGDASCVLWPRSRVLLQQGPEAEAGGEGARGGHHMAALPLPQLPLWFQMRLWTQARVAGCYTARCMAGALDPLEEEDGGVCWELFAHATSLLGHKAVLLGAFNGQGLGPEYERALRTQVITEDGLVRGSAGSSHTSILSSGSGASAVVQVQVRVTPGREYAKIVLYHGRVVGALLLGEAAEDLGETLENLILNKTSVRVQRSVADHAGASGQGTEQQGAGMGWPQEEDEQGQLLDLLDPNIDIEDYFD